VNCPGCHSHAFPALNRLWAQQEPNNSKNTQESKKEQKQYPPTAPLFDVYAISTAFEDFEYNTIESTRLLVTEGRRVGVVKEQLGESAYTSTSRVIVPRNSNNTNTNKPLSIPWMPVAFDTIISRTEASSEFVAQAIQAPLHNARQHLESVMQLPPTVVEQSLASLTDNKDPSVLADKLLPDYMARVFYAVAAQGTPTWILHDEKGYVLDRIFGQHTPVQLQEWAIKCIAAHEKETPTTGNSEEVNN
jgi:hypothetical protein